MTHSKMLHGALPCAAAILAMSVAHAANQPPVIDGTPPTDAIATKAYLFEPTASDPENQRLRFQIKGKPRWASFSSSTGRLSGTPQPSHEGSYRNIQISVSDGRRTAALPRFNIVVHPPRKENYGHYFSTRYGDEPHDVAMLCEQAGVEGVIWRRTWSEVEPAPGVYDFSSFDQVLEAIRNSHNPDCQLWLFVEYKSFANSPLKNPCPPHLQAAYSAPNADGNEAHTCFMWEPVVKTAYGAMVGAAAARYDTNPRVEGMIFQESALGFNGAYSQDVADGGTYTAERWRDALVELVGQCGSRFRRSRCLSFLNFIRGGQAYLDDVSAALARIPINRGCISGPDLLPDDPALTAANGVYEVVVRHAGCRSNSAQFHSFDVPGCDLECIFKFGVGGTFGDFPNDAPREGGVCVNSYFFWSHRISPSSTGLDWTSALPVIAAYPYGPSWLEQCAGGGGPP